MTARPPAFAVEHRGYTVRGWYGEPPGSPGRIEVRHASRGVVSEWECASYRIWNVAAHAHDIVEDIDDEYRAIEQGARP